MTMLLSWSIWSLSFSEIHCRSVCTSRHVICWQWPSYCNEQYVWSINTNLGLRGIFGMFGMPEYDLIIVLYRMLTRVTFHVMFVCKHWRNVCHTYRDMIELAWPMHVMKIWLFLSIWTNTVVRNLKCISLSIELENIFWCWCSSCLYCIDENYCI